MNKDIAIRVDSLAKSYKLYERPLDRLKESLHPFSRKYSKEFFALKNISFEVRRGETIGIIGKNGAGKSTLLKLITGVVTPTSGNVEVNGKISALLELGAGFNPEFTGIENVYMNGTIMGYSRKEVDEKMDEILAFADIGEFVHQPVKMYSSGMFVRLAFAVNACISPDILIVDEALSVGDVFFQNKCFRKFEEIRANNTPVLFVSHDLQSIKRFCDKVLWLQNGTMMMFGEKDEVCSAYFNYQFELLNKEQSDIVANLDIREIQEKNACVEKKIFPVLEPTNDVSNKLSQDVELLSFFICDSENKQTKVLNVNEEYYIHSVGRFNSNLDDLIFGFVLENAQGINLAAVNTYISSKKVFSAKAGEIVEVIFKLYCPKLVSGQYLLSPAIARGNQETHIMLTWLHNAIKIDIVKEGYNISLLEIDSSIKVNTYQAGHVEFS